MRMFFRTEWLGAFQHRPTDTAEKPTFRLPSLEALEDRVLPSITTAQFVEDIRVGSNGSIPSLLTNVNGTLFFRAIDNSVGIELFESDGTSSGTTLVKDIRTGPANSSPNFLTPVGKTLFFTADDGSNGSELWKSDGTSAGTTLIKDIRSGTLGSNPRYLTNVNGTLYFSANDGNYGYELWQSDGTSNGTTLVRDINVGSANSFPLRLTDVEGRLFFAANDGSTGTELWQSDGTSNGTTLVKDIRIGSNGSFPSSLIAVEETLFFTANDGSNGAELWKSDGTSNGTKLVSNLNGTAGSGASNLTNVNGIVFFTADAGLNNKELFKSDGTSSGTTLVKDINPGSLRSDPRSLTNVNGTLFFSANDGSIGYELWQSDGTSNGTTPVKDINLGTVGSFPVYLSNVDGTLFFQASDKATGNELWQSDGTSTGTTLVKDIRNGSLGSAPRDLTNVNGTLFFRANDGSNGFELWKTRPRDLLAIGAETGGGPHVRVLDADTLEEIYSFFAYNPGFTGGVRVALGDVTGDGIDDIVTAAGPGGGPHVKVFDGIDGSEIHSFFAYVGGFLGGVFVSTGDVNGDGFADIIAGAGAGGGPHVRVFNGADPSTVLRDFFAYDPNFLGGVTVAGGDINDDGRWDIITGAGAGGSPHVRIFESGDAGSVVDFFAYDAGFTGGVFVAAGDIDGDGFADILTGAGAGGGPHVRAFGGGGTGTLADFFAFDASFSGGVRVSANDVNNDGLADLVASMGLGGDQVKIFDAKTATNLTSFLAYDPSFQGGVFVASGDINGDGFDDIITGAGAGHGPTVRVFDGKTGQQTQSFSAYVTVFTGGVHVAIGDVDGDGFADIITGAGAGGGPHVKVFDGLTNAEIHSFFAYTTGFLGGVYVAAGDVNGDGFADILTGAGAGGGPHVKVFDGQTGAEIHSFLAYAPSFAGGVRVTGGDINGDGKADIITGPGASGGAHIKLFDGQTGIEFLSFFAYDPSFLGGVYLSSADINGDGFADILTGAGEGGSPYVRVFDGKSIASIDEFFATDLGTDRGVRVAAGDINDDGSIEIITAAGPGGDPLVRSEVDRFFAFAGFGGGVFVS